MQTNFGPGFAYLERIDVTGSGIGPRSLLALQDLSFDFDWTTKPLKSQYQMAIAIARSDQKITGKATFAAFQGRIISDICFGVTPATGQLSVATGEAQTVPATSPYTVTVSNASEFDLDLGVAYATTGIPFNRVSSPSAAGTYSVNESTGVYTFSAADEGQALLIAYAYNTTSSGLQTTLTNQLAGVTPQFKLTFANPISPGPPGGGGQTLPLGVHLNAATASKLSLPFKVDDWVMQALDFEAFADASNNVGTISSVQ
jgi:hypothetical protein